MRRNRNKCGGRRDQIRYCKQTGTGGSWEQLWNQEQNKTVTYFTGQCFNAMGFDGFSPRLFLGSYWRNGNYGAIRGPPCSVFYPSCKGLSDGRNVYEDREWSPYYAECKDQRLVGTGQCPTNRTLNVTEVSENSAFVWLKTSSSFDWKQHVLLTENSTFVWLKTSPSFDWKQHVRLTENSMFFWLKTVRSFDWKHHLLLTENSTSFWLKTARSFDWKHHLFWMKTAHSLDW